MKKEWLLIYYVIAIIFICGGFIVGTNTKEYNEGYRIYDYSHRVPNAYGGGYHYEYTELGNKHIQKRFGWYMNTIITNDYYYAGDIKIHEKTIKKSIPLEYYTRNYNTDFHNIESTSIIATIIMISLVLLVPFFISIIIKIFKKTSDNQRLKEMKKLKDKLDLNMISEEEYEDKKKKLMNKK